MTFCPSGERLTDLLSDALSISEREALVRHVEGCASCQEQLARLTGIPDTEMWRRAEHPPRGSRAENRMIRRLKGIPSWLVPTLPLQAVGPASPSPHAFTLGPAAGCEWPTVPGYEILGELGRGGMGV